MSVATIKYGMLNHDTGKDIVFELKDWTARGGNNGPYMLYAYAPIASVLREVQADPDTPLGQAASGEVIKTYEEVVMTAALDDLLRDNTSRLLRGGRETKNMDEDIEVPTL